MEDSFNFETDFSNINHFFARLSTSFLYFLKKIFMKNLLERYIKGTST